MVDEFSQEDLVKSFHEAVKVKHGFPWKPQGPGDANALKHLQGELHIEDRICTGE